MELNENEKTNDKNKWMAKMEMHVFLLCFGIQLEAMEARACIVDTLQMLGYGILPWQVVAIRLIDLYSGNVKTPTFPSTLFPIVDRFSLYIFRLDGRHCRYLAAKQQCLLDQSDLLFDISIDSGKITDWINCVCVSVLSRSRRIFVWHFFCYHNLFICLLFGVLGNKYLQNINDAFLFDRRVWKKIDSNCLIVRCCVEMKATFKANRKCAEPMAISIVRLSIFELLWANLTVLNVCMCECVFSVSVKFITM